MARGIRGSQRDKRNLRAARLRRTGPTEAGETQEHSQEWLCHRQKAPASESGRYKGWLSVFVGQGFGGAHAALDFGLEIAAEIFGDDAGSSEFTKIRNGEMRQEGEDGGKRRVGIANQGETYVVGL